MYANHQNVNREDYQYDPKANPIDNAINNMKCQWPMPQAMEEQLRKHMSVIRKLKDERLLIPEMYVMKLFYLNVGLLKLSSEVRGEKKTLDFWDGGGEYVLMMMEFLEGKKNEKFYIEAMEDCELVVIDKAYFHSVLDTFLEAHIIIERIAHLKTRRRINHMEILKLNSKYRYEALDAPDCLYKSMRLKQRISHHEMSKFLGMSETTLSRNK